MIKRVVYAAILGNCVFLTTANAKTLELSPHMSDRYERNCQVRLQPDLYHGNITPTLAPNVLKDRQQAHGVGTLVSLNLTNVQYRNVPVTKIEYVVNPVQRSYSQSLYLDLTSATAKQNFSKIYFPPQNGLTIVKEGRFTVVRCHW